MNVILRLLWTLFGRQLAEDALHLAVDEVEKQLSALSGKAKTDPVGVAVQLSKLGLRLQTLDDVRAQIAAKVGA